MNSRAYRLLLHYGMAIGSTALALVLTLLLQPVLSQSISLFFFVAITLTTWYGGLRPGIVAIILSTLAISTFFVTPLGSLANPLLSEFIRLVTFSFVALMIRWLKSDQQKSQRRVEQLNQQRLDESIDEHKQAQLSLQQQYDQQRLVMDMTNRVRQSLNLQEILQTTVDEVRQFLQVDRVILFQFAPGWGGTVTVESVVDEGFSILPFNIYDPCIGSTYVEPFQQGLVTAKADIYTADISPCHVEFLAQFQVRANLVVPIMKNDELWGLLAAHHCVAPRQWQDSEINLLRQLAAQVSIALQQADLFEQIQTELVERKRTEIELRDRERLFSTLAEALPVVIFRFDRNSHCVYINNYWTTLTGRTIESVAGLGWVETLHPQDRDLLAHEWLQWSQNPQQRGLYQNEGRLVHINGHDIWYYIQALPEVDTYGETIGFIGVMTNITDRKQTEEALQQSEARLRQFNVELEQRVAERTRELAELNNRLLIALKEQHQAKQDVEDLYNKAPCGYHSLDAEGTIVRINDTELQWLGYTREEVLNHMKFTDLLPTDSQLAFRQNFPEFIQRGWVNDLEFQLLHKDGSTRWISVNGTAITDETGKFVMSRSSMFDISERKRSEAERKQAENILQQYERIIANTTDGIALVNRNYIYQIANQGYLNWCNKRSAEVIGNSVRNILGDELFDHFIQPRLDQCLSGETVQYEKWFDYPNLIPQFLSVTYTPYRHANGTILGVIVSLRDLTRLKRAEQMLELQAIITRNMAEGICLVKADDATIVYANPKFEQMFGYDLGELNGQHVSVVNYADETITAEAVNQSIRAAVLQNREATYEVHNVKKDGTPFWCSATCSVFKHPEYGDVLVAVHQDISDHKHAEAALQQQTRQKQLLWNISQTIRQSLELDIILKAAVTEVRQILGVDRAAVYRFNVDWSGDFMVESVADGWIKLVEPNVCKLWEDTYLQETQGGRFQNHETLTVADIYAADLQPCHIDLLEQFQARAYAIAPIFVGESLWGLFAIYQNKVPYRWENWEIELLEQISSQMAIALQQSTLYSQLQIELQERERAAAVLREAERRWRSLLDNVQLIVVGLDQGGHINYVNPFFLHLTGYSDSEVLGKSWFEHFLPPSSQKAIQGVFSEVLSQNAHPHYQNSILTKSGEERFIAWNNTMLQDLGGNIIGTISIGEDITERRKIDQMKQDFISVVSHELRTPLTSIRGSLGLIAGGVYDKKPEKMKEMIAIAARQSDRLVRLVNDILNLRRLESGQSRFKFQHCFAADLIQQSVDVMRAQAEENQITLSIIPTTAEVWADADAIVQTLTNLLSNAIKFSPPNSTVTITATPSLAPSHTLFSVQDQGRGIPVDQLETIFGQFQQVDASDSREKGGTGLGLAICCTIIKQHNGRIWVESTLEQGSTFYFTLPSTQMPSDNG
jgi:PAS domain S-box-containing protein